MLKFLGRGSAFADENNSAFFIYDKDLILIDCPATSFHKIKKINLSSFERIYILITHTHGDHSGGVGAMLQYAYFALNNPITIVAPSELVKIDLCTLLIQIEGCEEEWFNVITADELEKTWFVSAIATNHVKALANKCFGYHLKIDDKDIFYTGDTSTLKPFTPLLKPGSILYTEISVVNIGIHLYIDEILDNLIEFTKNGITVFLMHLDNETVISEKIQGTDIKLAPLLDINDKLFWENSFTR